MRLTAITVLLIFCFLTGKSQERLSLLFNLTQSNNNYTFSDLFPDQPTFGSPIILPANDQYGISARKSKENGRFYEVMMAASYYQRSVKLKRQTNPLLEDSGAFTSTNFDWHLRMEVGKSITFEGLPNLYFCISASLDPRFVLRNYSSSSIHFFPFKTLSIETSVFVNPQIEYSINDRIIFLLKMPLQVFALNSIFVESINPNKPLDQLFNRQFVDFLAIAPTYSIGVGYYLSHKDR
jgi:hypothetical protein